MNSISQIPTDNLYKFLAIFGLLILIFVNSIVFRERLELALRIADLQYEANKIEAEATFLENDSMELKQKQAEWFEYHEASIKKGSTDLTKEKVEAEKSRFGNDSKEIIQRVNELKLKIIEIRRTSDKLKMAQASYYVIKILFFFGNIFGSMLTVFGFLFWYLKSQVYLDLIIKKESRM